MEVLQLLVSGVSQGCVYGLVALGFVLIYKATEMVNFAQGDLMMLGAFVGYGFVVVLDWPFVAGLVATLVVMAAVGVVIEHEQAIWPETKISCHRIQRRRAAFGKDHCSAFRRKRLRDLSAAGHARRRREPACCP